MPERDIDLVRAEQAARNAQRAREAEAARRADALAAHRRAEAAEFGPVRNVIGQPIYRWNGSGYNYNNTVRGGSSAPTDDRNDNNGGLNWPPAPPVVPPLNVNIDTQWEDFLEEPLQPITDALANQPDTDWNIGNRFDFTELTDEEVIAALLNGTTAEGVDVEALVGLPSETQVAFDDFLPLVPEAIQVQLTLLHQEGVTYTYPTAENLITTEFATPIETLEVDTAHWMVIEEGYQAVVEAQQSEQRGAGARGELGGGGKQNEILGLAALAVGNMLAQVLRALGQYDAAREMMEELKRRANEAVENLLSDSEQIPLGEGDTGGEVVVDPAAADVPEYEGGFTLLPEERGANVVTSSDETPEEPPRNYVPSPKHERGGAGTQMDLDPETAQQVLEEGIGSGRQVYGYHNGQLYTFQPDNAGGYHGYPVPGSRVPIQVLREMRDQGTIATNAEYERLRKEKN